MFKTSFAEKYAAHQKKIKAREDRIHKEESELEKERNALVDEGRKHFDGQLIALRAQAAGYAEHAAKALAALPPRPAEPKPDLVDTIGVDEYVSRVGAYPVELEAFEQAAIEASQPLAIALRGLVHQAGSIRTEARKLGFGCFSGIGFVYESERKPDAVAGSALSALGLRYDNYVDGAISLAERGELTALQAAGLAVLLRKQPEQGAAEQPATIWQRIQRLAGEREQAAEFERRGGVPLTQQQRDVERCQDIQAKVWPGGVTPTHVLNLELGRKAQEAEEQRRAERRAEEERKLEELGFARTGGE